MPLRNEPIEVFNRYTGATEVERVYGESWLRWTYESGLGRASLHALVKRAWFSRWYGWRMSRPASATRVEPFIAQYGLDASELDRPADSFATFNEFFSRPLRAGARPIDPDVRSVVFPADGRHLGFARWGTQDRVYAKGQSFDLASLLGDAALGREFAGGALVISRLCPVDYHRFHFPIGGVAGAPRAIEGPLFSVSPIALRRRVEYLVENKRVVTIVGDSACGRVAVVEIGATCVGTIVQTHTSGRVEKGAEKGLFRFGGSCVVTVFQAGRVALADDLVRESLAGREIYARMGDRMGTVRETPVGVAPAT
jgi:phosphatidylserine decarboxylase